MTRVYFCCFFKEILPYSQGKGIIGEICQNERFNHTLGTVQKHTVFAHVWPQKPVALF